MSGRFPKIPIGITVFVASISGYTFYSNSKRANPAAEVNKVLHEDLKRANNNLEEVKEEIQNMREDIKNITPKNESSNKIKHDELLLLRKTLDKSNDFLNNFNWFSIKDIFNSLVDYLSKFDLLVQALIFNILCSALIFQLLIAFILGKFGNVLIERYNLESRYPKLSNILKYRMQFHKYYFVYLTIIALYYYNF